MKYKFILTSLLLMSLFTFRPVSGHAVEHESVQLLSSADSLQLSVLYTVPSDEMEIKGVLQLVHGMCEHKERYIPFMEYMSENGWICVIHDHRGHGASVRYPNELGYFYDGGYLAMIDDVKVVTDWIESRFPDTKISMLGHSMGSMVVRSYLKKYDEEISRLIVCGTPSYDPASRFGVSMTKKIIKKYGGMSRPVKIQKLSFNSFNRRFKGEGSQNAWVCSDPAVVSAYDQDPLCNFQFTANGFYNLLSLMQYTYDKEGWTLGNPDLPIHFISGSDDPCLSNERKFNKAVDFLRSVGYANVTSHLYPGMRHEILNEKDKMQVWSDVLKFLEKGIQE